MTIKELLSEWQDMKKVLVGGFIASVAQVLFSIWVFYKENQSLFLTFILFGLYLVIVFLSALRIYNKKTKNYG